MTRHFRYGNVGISSESENRNGMKEGLFAWRRCLCDGWTRLRFVEGEEARFASGEKRVVGKKITALQTPQPLRCVGVLFGLG